MSSMTAAEEVQSLLSGVEIDEERFVGLLTKLIDNVVTLQNNPSQVWLLFLLHTRPRSRHSFSSNHFELGARGKLQWIQPTITML